MKLGGLLAATVPELRRMTGAQLFRAWGACAGYGRNTIYLHLVVLMVCASILFNSVMRLSESFMLDMLGLVVGLLLPPNIYFHIVFKARRAALRQFIEENWEEFRPE